MLTPFNSLAQCITGVGNIFNATLILTDEVIARPDVDESFVAISDGICVGESIAANVNASASHLTIWSQDPLSSVKTGLSEGDTFEILLKTVAGNVPLTMETDAVYIIAASSADTTLSATLDSLETEINDLVLLINDLSIVNAQLQARADSLQGLVDNFPDISQLQSDLVAANVTINTFEVVVSDAESRISGLIALIKAAIQ